MNERFGGIVQPNQDQRRVLFATSSSHFGKTAVVARRDEGGVRSPQSHNENCWFATSPVARQHHPAHDHSMRVVATSNNPVRLSFLTALLADAGIEAILFDNHTSILEGSAGAIPRRLVVSAGDFTRACQILHDAGEW
jgi:hypothetical protein